MSKSTRIGNLELTILDELWRRGEATVVEIHEALRPTHGFAPTTVSTMLRRMEEKQLVDHRTEQRRFVYRPLVERQELRRSMVGDLVSQLFGGNPEELLCHLVEEGGVDSSQIDRLRELVVAKQRGARR